MKKISLLLAIVTLSIACSKDNETTNGASTPVENFGELRVDPSFDWSLAEKGTLTVNFNASSSTISFEGDEVQLMDANQVVLDRKFIKNKKVSFTYSKPATEVDLYVYYPKNDRFEEVKEDKNNLNVTLAVNDIYSDYATLFANAASGFNTATLNKTNGTNLITNGDFETNSFQSFPSSVSNWNTNIWYATPNEYEHANGNGGKVYKSKDTDDGYTMQLLDVTAYQGGTFDFSATSNDKNWCVYIFYYDASYNFIGYYGWLPNAGNNDFDYNNKSIPSSAAYAVVKLHGKKNKWIDDVVFDATPGVQDADGDGVADNIDDYPNDATRAYNSAFPTSGYQTVAFEDLWPFQGDYDFNDVVLSNQVNWVRNANNELVEATFTMSLDAVGSGYANGLALVLLDNNKGFISQNMISSVSGDATLDPNVTNGIIVFNDVFAAQSTYYQNNNQGPSATPDVFTFTIAFNGNAGTQDLIPDTYIFRTDDRGLEIHLPGYAGTAAANASYYNTGDDVNGTYKTASGLPWAIEVITPTKSFDHPNEKVDITQAYPSFQTWAESEGSQSTNWLDNKVTSLIFNVL